MTVYGTCIGTLWYMYGTRYCCTVPLLHGHTKGDLGAGEPPFPVYIQYCRFLDHVQNFTDSCNARHIPHCFFSQDLRSKYAWTVSRYFDLRARPKAGTLGSHPVVEYGT